MYTAIVQVDECRRPIGLFTVQEAAMANAVNCVSSSAVANTATPNYLLWCTCSLQRAGLKLAHSAQGNQSSLQLCKEESHTATCTHAAVKAHTPSLSGSSFTGRHFIHHACVAMHTHGPSEACNNRVCLITVIQITI